MILPMTEMACYSPQYPDTFTDAALRQWIIDYYSTVDTDGAVESIADFLTEDASFVLGLQGATGRPGLVFFFLFVSWAI